MKNCITFGFIFCGSLILLNSCSSPAPKTAADKKADSVLAVPTKPPSNYSDTLVVNQPSAVFYYPDSLQLEKIKVLTEKWVFEGITHDFLYSMRNAQIVLKKSSPSIKIIEAKKVRYLLFRKLNHESVYIDLDTKMDPYGLYLFDKEKDPQLVDMMNIETELWNYFGNGDKPGISMD